MTIPSKNDARVSGKRGGAISKAWLVWQIEGESVTTAQLAERIGLHPSSALDRLKREQGRPGAVTWAGLAAIHHKGTK